MKRKLSQRLIFTWLVAGTALAQDPTLSVLVAERHGKIFSPPTASTIALPGDVLTLEIRGRCWSNGRSVLDPFTAPSLRGFTLQMDLASYSSGATGSITPVDFAKTNSEALCGPCGGPPLVTCPGNAANAYIDSTRVDYVFQGRAGFAGVQTTTCAYRFAGALFCTPSDCPTVMGFCPLDDQKYLGTIRVQVSANARGLFSICLDGGRDGRGFPLTHLLAESPGARIEPLRLECAAIDVVPAACDLSIVSAVPANGAIDARQPHDPFDATPQGLQAMEVAFSGDVKCVTPAHFEVSKVGVGAAPAVIEATPLDRHTIRIEFDFLLPPKAWARVTFNPWSGVAKRTSTCVGFLPGDVSGDGAGGSADVGSLRACLDSPGTCDLYQSDTDRSGFTTPQDIVRLVDVLMGANMFDPWNEVVLPPSPCP